MQTCGTKISRRANNEPTAEVASLRDLPGAIEEWSGCLHSDAICDSSGQGAMGTRVAALRGCSKDKCVGG